MLFHLCSSLLNWKFFFSSLDVFCCLHSHRDIMSKFKRIFFFLRKKKCHCVCNLTRVSKSIRLYQLYLMPFVRKSFAAALSYSKQKSRSIRSIMVLKISKHKKKNNYKRHFEFSTKHSASFKPSSNIEICGGNDGFVLWCLDIRSCAIFDDSAVI